MDKTMKDAIHKGVIGVLAPGVGYVVSISTVEMWLKLASLGAGILVSIAMFISLCFSIRRKYLAWKRETKINVKEQSQYSEETTTL